MLLHVLVAHSFSLISSIIPSYEYIAHFVYPSTLQGSRLAGSHGKCTFTFKQTAKMLQSGSDVLYSSQHCMRFPVPPQTC